MLTRQVRWQLIAFALIATVATFVAAIYYAKLPRLLGYGQYQFTVKFADATGLYPRALVTQNGVDIGIVKSITLGEDATSVVVSVDDSRKIPTDAHASIDSMTAIGEQYVDFSSNQTGGPYLAAGGVLPAAQSSGLPSAGVLLDSIDNLLKSIPTTTLTNVLQETSTAFGGTGTSVSQLFSSGNSLLQAALNNLQPTVALLNEAQPFLQTQLQLADTTKQYVANLQAFADQLVGSNSDIASILNNTGGFTSSVGGLVSDFSPTLPTLLTNLTAVGAVLETYLPNLQQTIALLPTVTAHFLAAVSTPYDLANQQGNLSFKFNLQDPPVCTNGYLPESEYQPTTSITAIPTPAGLYCRPLSTNIGVRTASNEPCAGLPGIRGATPEVCDEKAGRASTITTASSLNISSSVADGTDPNADYQPIAASSASSTASSPAAAVPYDSATGLFQVGGTTYKLGSGLSANGATPASWQAFVQSILGN